MDQSFHRTFHETQNDLSPEFRECEILYIKLTWLEAKSLQLGSMEESRDTLYRHDIHIQHAGVKLCGLYGKNVYYEAIWH